MISQFLLGFFCISPQKGSIQIRAKHPNKEQIGLDEAQMQMTDRYNELSPFFGEDEQSEQSRLFKRLADLTDDGAALAEMQDLGLL